MSSALDPSLAAVDLSKAATAPFEAAPHHAVMAALAGTWVGTCHTTFDPSQPQEVSDWALQATLILGGRALRIEYTGTAMGKPHASELLVGFDAKKGEWRLPWIDSFHTEGGVMINLGRYREDGVIDVFTRYEAGGQTWGWRTKIGVPYAGTLRIEAFNVFPDGQEFPALEVSLRRT